MPWNVNVTSFLPPVLALVADNMSAHTASVATAVSEIDNVLFILKLS